MNRSVSSKNAGQRVEELESQLSASDAALKKSIGDLADYAKPATIIKRAAHNRSDKAMILSMIQTLALIGGTVLLRKLFMSKMKRSLLQTAVSLLPLIIMRTLKRKRLNTV